MRLAACCRRWGLSARTLDGTIGSDFANKTVAVVGDVIADRYVFCDASDVAAEAPILSVRPLKEAEYLGGAAIVAAHLRGLGARVHLLTTLGSDPASPRLVDRLSGTGVQLTSWQRAAPIPSKERYLADTQKLLKVDRGHVQSIDSTTEGSLIGTLEDLAHELDAVVFCDYGYGLLSHSLLTRAIPMVRSWVGTITGDISGPRRTLLTMADSISSLRPSASCARFPVTLRSAFRVSLCA